MKLMKTIRVVAVMAAGSFALPAVAADGDPDVPPIVRAKEAVKLLKSRPQVVLLYVKGMT